MGELNNGCYLFLEIFISVNILFIQHFIHSAIYKFQVNKILASYIQYRSDSKSDPRSWEKERTIKDMVAALTDLTV